MNELNLKSRMVKLKPTTTTDTISNLMKKDDLSGVLATDITYIQLMNLGFIWQPSMTQKKRRVVSYGPSPG